MPEVTKKTETVIILRISEEESRSLLDAMYESLHLLTVGNSKQHVTSLIDAFERAL